MGKLHDIPSLRNRLFVFKNRKNAGEILAKMLSKYKGNPDAILLAIPSGGVPVAYEISSILKIPLRLIIVKKIPIPFNPEAGYGAIAWDGSFLLNEKIVRYLNLSEREIKGDIEKVRKIIEHRRKKFGFPLRKNERKEILIVVDDGIASGITMLTAINSLKRFKSKIIVAVPTAHEECINLLYPHVDEIYCPNIRRGYPFAVADAYKEWHDVGDEEVIEILKKVKEKSYSE